MERIPYDEVRFHPHSFADPDGRLFWWKGQLYRGLRSEWAVLFRRLFQEGVIQRLVDRGLLVETEPTTLNIDGYAMVVRHRPVPFASYPEEWCPSMLRDAALAILELLIELAPCGLTLKDSHPWNLLFDLSRPVYVDLTSITLIQDAGTWPGYEEFCRFYLYPLILMAHKEDRIARRLLPEYEGVSKADLFRLTRRTQYSMLPSSISSMVGRCADVPRVYARLRHIGSQFLPARLRTQSNSQQALLAFLEGIKREIEGITLPAALHAAGLSHDEDVTPSTSPDDAWTAKQRSLYDILTQLRPDSVLDIGSDTGWYSKLAALLGSRVVSFDKNLLHTTQLYYAARNKKLPILPLVMDFTDPTPSRGLASHWAIAATERFQCDMVMALTLVHQIVFKRHLNFEQIVDGLALFSKRWLVVEFAPRENRDVGERRSNTLSWYTLENFIWSLRRRFHTVNILPSFPKPRVLLLCEK